MIKLKKWMMNPCQTACHVLSDESGEAIIIDACAYYPKERENLIKYIENENLKPVHNLLTHGHFDHISAAEAVRDRYDIPVYACPLEGEMLREPSVNMTQYYGRPVSMKADIMPSDLEVFEVADFMVQMIFTPGHTKGSCCYYFKDENVLFSGDTLFHGSVGRTDFPGGSSAQIVESLHRLVDTLPEDTVVYPGHDMSTTIGYEKRYNPFV